MQKPNSFWALKYSITQAGNIYCSRSIIKYIMDTLKNITIVIMTIVIMILWTAREDFYDSDEDSVILQYKCAIINDYEQVPNEVLAECKGIKELQNESLR